MYRALFSQSSAGYVFANGSLLGWPGGQTPHKQYRDQTFYSDKILTIATQSGFSSIFDSIAASMTQFGLDVSKTTITGNVITLKVYVQVEWKWLILPFVLEIADMVLFLATMVLTR